VPKILSLAQERVHQIVNETHPHKEFSELEISRLTSNLNQTLSQYAEDNKLLCEPTAQQLRKQISAMHKALRRLKLVFPPSEQRSLRNYLIHLGEDYAMARGAHPNLEPRYVGGSLDNGDTWETILHYHSDKRLDQMISSVSQVLEWMDKAKKDTKDRLHWWDRPPLDEQTVEERFESADGWPIERTKLKETLIGSALPRVYAKHFGQPFRTSRGRGSGQYGPGVRFLASILQYAGVHTTPETIIKYQTRTKRSKTSVFRKP
jgi:hypothetical protein